MPSVFFTKLAIRTRKVALYSRDQINLEAFTDKRASDILVNPEPFPHIVVDDFFNPATYQALCGQFNTILEKGFLEGSWGPDYFHRFDIDYDGFVCTITGTLDAGNPTSLFFSLGWNWLFSKIFRQFVGFETSFAFHHHPPGDRTGFVHHDNVDKHFSPARQLANGVIYGEGPESDPIVSRRKIALLYFLNNDGWQEGDGGEVGLYSADKETLIKKVAPINNRMLAFQISERSMHAFQENRKNRNSIVQWFHVAPEFA